MADNTKDKELISRIAEATGLSASAIAVRAGMAASTLTRIMSDRGAWSLKPASIAALREAFPEVFEREDDAIRSAYIEVEVLPSYAGMGGGGTGEGDRVTTLVPRQFIEEKLRARPSDLIMIQARGDSMAPEFLHGDQILIDRRDTSPAQPGSFCLWDGDGYVVKLVERCPGKRGWLRIFSRNEIYTPYEVEADEVRIMGRPVWVGREL
ncbi:helix-turn-helix transcriptional regulator [Sphingomonas sp. MMS24-J13]|uniref:S24 family peptidase n=1 Tax=Sphingomonas sp. MMS24-J13 TaxID=3238686 RepID=UPI0038504B62